MREMNSAPSWRGIFALDPITPNSVRARECQAECLVDEILKIARDSSRDYVKKVGVDGKVTWVVDREHIARCGLRISTLKWMAARMAPRKFG